jgi:hypothetical protein
MIVTTQPLSIESMFIINCTYIAMSRIHVTAEEGLFKENASSYDYFGPECLIQAKIDSPQLHLKIVLSLGPIAKFVHFG